MDRDIIFESLKSPQDIFLLKEYIRELYRLLDKRFITVDFVAGITFDCDLAEVFQVTLTGNVTGITLKNPYKGRTITLIFLQNAVGNFTVAGWAADVKITGDTFTVTVTASVYSTITLTYTGSAWVEVSRSLDVR
jgi:hypothetical protein